MKEISLSNYGPIVSSKTVGDEQHLPKSGDSVVKSSFLLLSKIVLG
jgi:hypothetical protein